MRCKQCGNYSMKVIEYKGNEQRIRRRRKCLKCDYRITTYEITLVESEELNRIHDTYLAALEIQYAGLHK